MVLPPPLLIYQVTPAVVPHSAGPAEESVVSLMFTVTNDTGENVDVRRIAFAVRVGPQEGELAARAPFSVTAAAGVDWDATCADDGTITVSPRPPLTGLSAGQSVAFFASGLVVNERPGMSVIRVWEDSGERRMSSVSVVKTTPGLAITRFQASPVQRLPGDRDCILDWTTTGADSVTLTHGGVTEPVGREGPKPVKPRVTTLYTLTASGGGTSIHEQLTVYVPQVEIHSFAAKPAQIPSGGTTTLSWLLSNTEHAYIRASGDTPDPGEVNPLEGSLSVRPADHLSTTYTLTASGFGNSLQSPASVDLLPAVEYFTASPAQLPPGVAGLESTLRWKLRDATSVSIAPGIGPVSLEGVRVVKPAASTQYVLTAKRLEPPRTASVVVAADITELRYTADEFLGTCTVDWRSAGGAKVQTRINRNAWQPANGDGGLKAAYYGAVGLTARSPGGVNEIELWCAAGLLDPEGRETGAPGTGPADGSAAIIADLTTITVSCPYGVSSVGAVASLRWTTNGPGYGSLYSGRTYSLSGQSGSLDFPIGLPRDGNAWTLRLGMHEWFIRAIRAQ